MSDSILDKVLSQKHADEVARFVPHEILQHLLGSLTSREREVLTRRFGLGGEEAETLEKIGDSFEVTRERIRQIERMAIQKIREAPSFSVNMTTVEHVVNRYLEEAGGVLSTDTLLSRLIQTRDRKEQSRAILHFLLYEIIPNRFKKIQRDKYIRDGWALRVFDVGAVHQTLERLAVYFKERAAPAKTELVVQEYHERNPDDKTDEEQLRALLNIAKNIQRNPFDEYGLRSWSTVVPKRMTDKIYLVLKHDGKPMHFSDITKQINASGFDQKIAYAPTVHNELIMDKRYVLVGRGIYALRELGYKPGVVADVIEDVIRQVNEPMRRDDIVDAVLKQRVVGKATVHLALMNKERFTKLSDGRYRLTEHQSGTQEDAPPSTSLEN